jgi:hypothetical protein
MTFDFNQPILKRMEKVIEIKKKKRAQSPSHIILLFSQVLNRKGKRQQKKKREYKKKMRAPFKQSGGRPDWFSSSARNFAF